MEIFGSYILVTTVALPILGAALVLGVPIRYRHKVWTLTFFIATLTLMASLYVFVAYYLEPGGIRMASDVLWLRSLGISLQFGVDGLSAPMVLLTGIVFFVGVLVSMNVGYRSQGYFSLLLLLVGGVFGVFASLDAFFFFFFYELAVLPMYLLIGMWGSTTDFKTFLRTKEYSAMKLVLYLVGGSVLVWIALLALFVEAGRLEGIYTFDMTILKEVGYSPTFQKIVFPFLMVGFGVLAGLWPFHTWSPDGHVAAPTAVSMLHAGVLMKLGAFGIVRVAMEVLPIGAITWMPVLVALGTMNVLYGGISAMGQRDLKYVVGYSSVSHMGIVLMGLGTLDALGVGGAMLQMFSHGIMTALLFAAVGTIYDRAHVRDITLLEGLFQRMPKTGIFLVIAGLTSLGLPGLSGFVAELLVFMGLFQKGGGYVVLGVLGVLGAAITAVYILRLFAKVLFGPIGQQWTHLSDSTRVETVAGALLVSLLVLVGVVPFPMLRVIDSGVMPFLQGILGA